MVHRPPDSRLLTNLITNEKEYAKHFASLFSLSHAALASLSAYAAASPATPAHVIAAVVDLFASADDALQRYTNAIETWREQLSALKTLEDDLAAVLRDRDILVTRLLKASKATREAHRSSRLNISGIGSASLSSLPSTSTGAHSVSGTSTSPASTNAKLAQAQAELQACEAHLVTKERELDARRITVARDGLGARCRALIDCGWVWGEMGKQGLRTLQALTANGPSQPGSNTAQATYASDNSSLTPSQSASQTAARSASTSHEGKAEAEPRRSTEPEGNLTIAVPPAHAIPDLTLPTVVRLPLPQQSDLAAPKDAKNAPAPTPAPATTSKRKRSKRSRRPPSQHIPEVSDEGSDLALPPPNANGNGSANTRPSISVSAPMPFPVTTSRATNGDGSSSEDEPEGPYQVVENDPFDVIRRRSVLGPSPSAPLLATLPNADPGSSDASPSPSKPTFASVGPATGSDLGRGHPSTGPPAKRERRTSFFGSLRGLFRKPKERAAEWDPELPKPNASPNKGWVTRADARMQGQGEDSDEGPVMDIGRGGPSHAHTTRLRKGRPRGHEGGAGAAAAAAGTSVSMDGWVTDAPSPSGNKTVDRSRTRRGTMKRPKTSVADLRGAEQGHTDGEVSGRPSESLDHVSSKGRGKVEEQMRVSANRVDELGRAATTTAVTVGTRPRKSSEHRMHRRSASLSLMDAHAAFMPVEGFVGTRTPSSSPSPSPPPSPPPATSTPAKAPTRASTEVQSKPTHANGRRPNGHTTHGHGRHAQNQSLMAVVADVTRRDGDVGAHVAREGTKDKASRARSMDVPRAPGSVLREPGHEEADRQGRSRRVSMGAGAAQDERGVSQGQGRVGGQGTVKMPLRSALRNTSRTPSPIASPVSTVVPVPTVSARGNEGERKKPAVGAVEEVRVGSPSSWRDSVSVSSYATGRESLSLDVDEDDGPLPSDTRTPKRMSAPMLTIPPPPMGPPPGGVAATTTTDEKPLTRRKSVRVSLQPTFSPSPPALSDEGHDPDEDGFGPGKKSMWEDSTSDEDGEAARAYDRARALLSLVGKDGKSKDRDKGKGKGKGRAGGGARHK